MKALLALVLLLLVVAGSSLLAYGLASKDAGHAGVDLEVRLEQLSAQLTELSSEVEALRRQPPAGTAELAPAQRVVQPTDATIEAAVARWMAANAGSTADARTARSVDPAAAELANLELADLLEMVRDDSLTADQLQSLWQRIAKSGRVDEVLAELEKLAAADPYNPDMQVELASAYLYKIFEVGAGPLAGEFANKADAAYARAIELDDQHIEARLMKAVALSNWPAFMGKTPQAIREFEELIDLQSGMPASQQSSDAYLVLGNLYMQSGEQAKALATWRQGLANFPDNASLLQQLQSNE